MRHYLGDDIWADSDGHDITLTVENYEVPTNKIVLSPTIFQNLVEFRIRVRAARGAELVRIGRVPCECPSEIHDLKDGVHKRCIDFATHIAEIGGIEYKICSDCIMPECKNVRRIE